MYRPSASEFITLPTIDGEFVVHKSSICAFKPEPDGTILWLRWSISRFSVDEGSRVKTNEVFTSVPGDEFKRLLSQ